MAGLNFGSIFDGGGIYNDDGSLKVVTVTESGITIQGNQVWIGGNSTAAGPITYTVPVKKVFYLSKAYLTESDAITSYPELGYTRNTIYTTIISMKHETGVNDSWDFNFSMPLIFQAGDIIKLWPVTAGSNAQWVAMFGWLADA